MTLMTEADTDRCLEIADELRSDLQLHDRSPAIPKIQSRMLAAFSEGFRRGFWSRDEDDKLQAEGDDL